MSWQPCYSTPLEVQAHLVKGYLEQFGVPCMLDSHRFGMKPLTFGALGEVRVLVREDWLDVARGLIRGRERDARAKRRTLPGSDA
jgi:hypothetical protein